MRTLILSAYDNAMESLGRLTEPRLQQYADRHKFEFRCVREFPPGVPAYWHKMRLVPQAFRDGIDRVIWLDCDQVVTNFELIPPGDSGFSAGMDWGVDAVNPSEFSMCGFVAYPDSKVLFQWVLDHEDVYLHGPFPDQAPMRFLSMQDEYKHLFHIHPRRVFGSVPEEVCPGQVPEKWVPGDWCCHVTMVSIPERVKIFHEILKQL